MSVTYYHTKVKDYRNGVQQFIRYVNPIVIGKPKKLSIHRADDSEIEKLLFEMLGDPIPEKSIEAQIEAKKHSKKSSISRTKNNIYDLAQCNEWQWFITLTFDPLQVNRQDYTSCSRLVKMFLDETRRISNGNFKYLGVPEYHADGVSFHFHFIFSGIDDTHFTYSHDDGYNQIYNLAKYSYGFTTATRIRDTHKVSGYITKYITKTITDNLSGKKRYWSSRNLLRPKVHLIKEHIDLDFLPIPTYSNEISITTSRYSNHINYDIIDFNKTMEVFE